MKAAANKILLFLSFVLSLECAEHQDIKGECSEEWGDLMTRYHVIHTSLFRIYIHKIYRSDVAVFHDHARRYLTVILRGGYVEHTPTGSRKYRPGSILYRGLNSKHWLELERPAMTIFIAWGRGREWGFYENGPGEMVPWHKYNYAQGRC